MDRNHIDHTDHGNNLNDSESDVKLGRDFCNLVQHPGMDHLGDVEVEVSITSEIK